jgi:4'-phosphopantetheinyl transferase
MIMIAPAAAGSRTLDVDVYTIDLDVPDSVLRARRALLWPDEYERAVRYRFERDRNRFIACRGAVRSLIGARVRADPSSLRFRYGAHGKPEVAGHHSGSISFNVSHSEGMALCAIAAESRLGVDVERVRRLPDLDSIAAGFFSPRERAFLRDSALIVREERFFELWTRKEAWLKAQGDGLLGPLTRIEVLQAAEGDPWLAPVPSGFRLRTDSHGTSWLGCWVLQSFAPARGFVAALATSAPARVSVSTWTDP